MTVGRSELATPTINRSRLIRLFKMTVRVCDDEFSQHVENGTEPDAEQLAEQLEKKFRSGILVSIAVGILIQLLVAWIKKLWEDYNGV